jgi:hypothetical protein
MFKIVNSHSFKNLTHTCHLYSFQRFPQIEESILSSRNSSLPHKNSQPQEEKILK